MNTRERYQTDGSHLPGRGSSNDKRPLAALSEVSYARRKQPNDRASQEPLPGDPDGAGIDDAPMSDPDNGELTEEDVELFEDDPDIPTV